MPFFRKTVSRIKALMVFEGYGIRLPRLVDDLNRQVALRDGITCAGAKKEETAFIRIQFIMKKGHESNATTAPTFLHRNTFDVARDWGSDGRLHLEKQQGIVSKACPSKCRQTMSLPSSRSGL